MRRQDIAPARTPADVERRLGVDRKIEEVKGIATDARYQAVEAQRVASSIEQNNTGLEMRVKDLENAVDGTFALEIVEAEGKRYSQLRSDVDKVKFASSEFEIDSDEFSLKDGQLTAKTDIKDENGASIFKASISLANGVTKVDSPTRVDGLHRYIPLIEFTYTSPTTGLTYPKVLVADFYNGEQWMLYVADGNFAGFTFGETDNPSLT